MQVLLIYNPVAGQRDVAADLERVIAFLRAQGWQVTLRKTLGQGDATTYAREAAAQGYDMAVAVGGDGTIGEVASGLVESQCTLGVLPVGTGNVWAHMLGLPVWTPLYREALLEAAQVLVAGQAHEVDLGLANGRYFMLWAGVGFDAQVAHDIEPHREMRRSLGNILYVVTALVSTLSLRGTRATITIDGQSYRQRILMAVVSNAQLYGPSLTIAPGAQLDDGLLDVYVFKGANTLDIFRHLFLIMAGKHTHDSRVDTYLARSVHLRSARPLPLHLDGDPHGYTPLRITVVPRAVRVVVPTWASSSLFEEGQSAGQAPSLAERIASRLRLERERLRTERDRLLHQGERLYTDWEHRLLYGTPLPPPERAGDEPDAAEPDDD
jgi:YegS/Rv2252/BmrU family lipid kinase